MMIVRAAPNRARTQDQPPEHRHQAVREPGMEKNGLMLLIMVDNEKTKDQQTGEDAAYYFPGQVEIIESAGQCSY